MTGNVADQRLQVMELNNEPDCAVLYLFIRTHWGTVWPRLGWWSYRGRVVSGPDRWQSGAGRRVDPSYSSGTTPPESVRRTHSSEHANPGGPRKILDPIRSSLTVWVIFLESNFKPSAFVCLILRCVLLPVWQVWCRGPSGSWQQGSWGSAPCPAAGRTASPPPACLPSDHRRRYRCCLDLQLQHPWCRPGSPAHLAPAPRQPLQVQSCKFLQETEKAVKSIKSPEINREEESHRRNYSVRVKPVCHLVWFTSQFIHLNTRYTVWTLHFQKALIRGILRFWSTLLFTALFV